MINQSKVTSTIEKALELSTGTITINSSIENTEKWDSLGQLSILSALDELFNGKIADIPEIASTSSVKSLIDILKANNLIE